MLCGVLLQRCVSCVVLYGCVRKLCCVLCGVLLQLCVGCVVCSVVCVVIAVC